MEQQTRTELSLWPQSRWLHKPARFRTAGPAILFREQGPSVRKVPAGFGAPTPAGRLSTSPVSPINFPGLKPGFPCLIFCSIFNVCHAIHDATVQDLIVFVSDKQPHHSEWRPACTVSCSGFILDWKARQASKMDAGR